MAARRAWLRWSGFAGRVVSWRSCGRTTCAGSPPAAISTVSFGEEEMFVEFASREEAVELIEIFYPARGRRGSSQRSPAGLVRDAGRQSSARRRVQGDGGMKLAIVAPLVSAIREPQRGGSQAFVSELARGLVQRGHDVHLYAASGSAVQGVEVIDTGVDHRELAATLYRASAWRRRRLDRRRAGVRPRLRRWCARRIRRRPQPRLRRARGQSGVGPERARACTPSICRQIRRSPARCARRLRRDPAPRWWPACR